MPSTRQPTHAGSWYEASGQLQASSFITLSPGFSLARSLAPYRRPLTHSPHISSAHSASHLDAQLQSWLDAVPSSSVVPSYGPHQGDKTFATPVKGLKALIGP